MDCSTSTHGQSQKAEDNTESFIRENVESWGCGQSEWLLGVFRLQVRQRDSFGTLVGLIENRVKDPIPSVGKSIDKGFF